MRIKRSKTKGVTLAELLIAIFILAAVIGPVMGMFMWSQQASIRAYQISIASVVAEMRMEELVGTEIIPGTASFEDKGFTVDIDIKNLEFGDLDDDLQLALNNDSTIVDPFLGFLKMVTVTVRDSSGAVLCTQRNIINTATNGFVSRNPES